MYRCTPLSLSLGLGNYPMQLSRAQISSCFRKSHHFDVVNQIPMLAEVSFVHIYKNRYAHRTVLCNYLTKCKLWHQKEKHFNENKMKLNRETVQEQLESHYIHVNQSNHFILVQQRAVFLRGLCMRSKCWDFMAILRRHYLRSIEFHIKFEVLKSPTFSMTIQFKFMSWGVMQAVNVLSQGSALESQGHSLILTQLSWILTSIRQFHCLIVSII